MKPLVDNTLRGITLVMAMALIHLKSLGVLAGNALHAFVGQRIGGKRLEDLSIPLAVVATDLTSGAARNPRVVTAPAMMPLEPV